MAFVTYLTQHGDPQLVFVLEVIHELLKCHLLVLPWLDSLHLEPVPQGPLCLIILKLRSWQWLRKDKERQGKVCKTILELLWINMPLDQLEEL